MLRYSCTLTKKEYNAFMTIILIIAIVVVGWFVLSYNGFIRGKNQYTEAWADIEVQLKRRYDLIPNLVNTVKGYATHESSAFEKVTEARSRAMQASSLADHASAEVNLGKAVTGLFGIAEAYPDLKANANFVDFKESSLIQKTRSKQHDVSTMEQ